MLVTGNDDVFTSGGATSHREDSPMLHSSDLHSGWRSALRSLADNVSRQKSADGAPQVHPFPDDGDDAEREPFHLDDTELAGRLVRDRGLPQYSTPPHAHLFLPQSVQP